MFLLPEALPLSERGVARMDPHDFVVEMSYKEVDSRVLEERAAAGLLSKHGVRNAEDQLEVIRDSLRTEMERCVAEGSHTRNEMVPLTEVDRSHVYVHSRKYYPVNELCPAALNDFDPHIFVDERQRQRDAGDTCTIFARRSRVLVLNGDCNADKAEFVLYITRRRTATVVGRKLRLAPNGLLGVAVAQNERFLYADDVAPPDVFVSFLNPHVFRMRILYKDRELKHMSLAHQDWNWLGRKIHVGGTIDQQREFTSTVVDFRAYAAQNALSGEALHQSVSDADDAALPRYSFVMTRDEMADRNNNPPPDFTRQINGEIPYTCCPTRMRIGHLELFLYFDRVAPIYNEAFLEQRLACPLRPVLSSRSTRRK